MINDMQFKMKGKNRSYSFWSWVLKKAQRKVKETEEKTVNLISVNFPSAFCMLIRYEIINTGQKYEIVMQGDYQDQYRSWKESEEKEIPEAVRVEWLITENHANAKQVAAKSIT
jgi:hypothetical protein